MNNRDILSRLREESDDITISNDIDAIKGEQREEDLSILPHQPRKKWLNRIITCIILSLVCLNLVWGLVGECQVKSVVVVDADESVTLYVNRSGRVIGVEMDGGDEISNAVNFYFRPLDNVINSMYPTINNDRDMMILCSITSEDAEVEAGVEEYLVENVCPLTVVKESGNEGRWAHITRDFPRVRFLLATAILSKTDEYSVDQLKQMDAKELYQLYQRVK